MCGIAGLVDRVDRRPIDVTVLDRMNESQRHRGPDGDGLHVEPGAGLAHRRLSIIDVAGGRQPIYNEDGTAAVVYNGEIYNFRELACDLVARGHRFRTRSDTEVIVHAWEEWGETCVERFRGMFAFAVWDRDRDCLFVARDRLGIKPLYYADLPDGTFAFASELKAILCVPGLPRSLDPCAVEEYFAYGYVPEPRSILASVRKLPPGTRMLIRRGRSVPDPSSYWDVPFVRATDVTLEEAQAELIERLREAVRIRLISEVPLGAFLSGGIDSSAVVAVMAGLVAGPVSTCTISFGERSHDESTFAAAVAARYGTDHHVARVEPEGLLLVDVLADHYDEPFADSSALPTYRVCELARRRVTVALSGDGGDENLAGYRRYRWHCYEERVRALFPWAVRGPLFSVAASLYPKADWAPRFLRAKATLEGIARGPVEGYFHSVSLVPDRLRERLYRPEFRLRLDGYHAAEVLRGHARRAPVRDPLSLVQYLDLKTYLPGDILTKVDRASMAHSLEVRVPMLDHPLVEWMSSLPPEFKLRGRTTKFLLKRALRPYLPTELLDRPKMGFSVPLATWFRGPLREPMGQALRSDVLRDAALFDERFIADLVRGHESGRSDHSATLWALLMFESSLRRVLGQETSLATAAG